MIKIPLKLKGILGYTHNKVTNVIDKTNFPVCEIKEKEIGFLRKRIWYIHRIKNGWEIIQIYPKYIHKVYSTTDE